jgi:hypothetical protein
MAAYDAGATLVPQTLQLFSVATVRAELRVLPPRNAGFTAAADNDTGSFLYMPVSGTLVDS